MPRKRCNHEFIDVVKCDIRHKDSNELKYEAYLAKNNLRLCSKIIHKTSENKNNEEVKIISHISSSSNDSCSNKVGNVLIRQESILSNDYIKAQTFTHCNKSKSLDGNHNYEIFHETEIETVTANSAFPNYETVFRTKISHGSDSKKKSIKQNSFIRPSVHHNPSVRSLPSNSVIDSLKSPKPSAKSSFTSKMFKKLKLNRKSSKLDSTDTLSSELDTLARKHAGISPSLSPVPQVATNNKSFLESHQVPFTSHKIGDPLSNKTLKPIKKQRKGVKQSKQYLNELFSINQNALGLFKTKFPRYSTDDKKMDKLRSGCVISVLKTEEGHKNFSYSTPDSNQYKDIDYIDDIPEVVFSDESTNDNEPSHRHNISDQHRNTSVSHFDQNITNTRQRKYSEPVIKMGPESCGCDELRNETISRILNNIINRSNSINEHLNILKKIDGVTLHLTNCPFGQRVQSGGAFFNNSGMTTPQTYERSSLRRRTRVNSGASLYQYTSMCDTHSLDISSSMISSSSCDMCNDDNLNVDFVEVIPSLIGRLENDNLIRIDEDHLNYFVAAKCYDHYEHGIHSAIGRECNLENIALLHYLTSHLVKYMRDSENHSSAEEISKRLLNFSEQYYNTHYMPSINEKHNSLSNFVLYHFKDEVD